MIKMRERKYREKKKRTSEKLLCVLIVICITLMLVPILPLKVQAAGPDWNSAAYNSENPLAAVGSYGQCVWYAWGRAYEVTGKRIRTVSRHSNAIYWIENNTGVFEIGTEPKANSVAVWGGSSTGHVAYVESVNGDTVTISEANNFKKEEDCAPYPCYNLSEGIKYYNNTKSLTKSEMQFRDGLFPLLGYIYLGVGKDIPDNSDHRPISDGDYFIVSGVQGDAYNPGAKCLTFSGLPGSKNTNGSNAELKSVYGQEGHLFTVTWLGNGFYKIKLKASNNQCLDVPDGSKEKGVGVHSWEDNGGENQQWYINETDDGNGYTIQAKCSGYYLDVDDGKSEDGTGIVLWEGHGRNNQRWYFIPWGGGSTAKQEIPDGEYHIVSQASNEMALNLREGETGNGTEIITWPCRDDSRHTFQVKWLGDGYYEIVNTFSGRSLDVASARSKLGTPVLLWDLSPDVYSRKWIIRTCGDGLFSIISKCNGLCLDYDDRETTKNRPVNLWYYYGKLAQKWRFIPWGGSIGQTIEDGEYQIVSQVGDGKLLCVDGSCTEATNGINVELNSQINDERSIFDIKYLGNGYYSIVNKNFNLVLDVADGGWNQGVNVQLWEANTSDVQKWMIRDCGDGTFNIISKKSGLNLDVKDGNSVDGTNIRMWEANTANAQKWKFVPYVRTVEVEAVTLNRDSLTMRTGEQASLSANISPENATDKMLIWESGDESVATVDSDGKVTAKAAGNTQITVRTANGKTATCLVTVHEHNYGTDWKTDDAEHWKECECGERTEESAHSYVWVTDKEATQDEEGLKHEECSICGLKRNEGTVITKLPADHEHNYSMDWKSDDAEHWQECECGERTEESAHSYVWVTDKEATQDEEGMKHEECTVCGVKKNERTVITKLPVGHEHNYSTDWRTDDEEHWKECECGEKMKESAHSYVWVIDKEATQDEEGIKHEECMVCGVKKNERTVITKLPADHEHSYSPEWKKDDQNHWKECGCGEKTEESAHSYVWVTDKEATQDEEGMKHEECTVCRMKRNERTAVVKLPVTHEHSYSPEWKMDVQNHWKECGCGEKTEESAHSYMWVTDREATQGEEGMMHEECAVCGVKRNEGTVIAKLPAEHEHSFPSEWKSNNQNHWRECGCGEKAEVSFHLFLWIKDKEATQDEEGMKHEVCTVCGLKRNEGTVIEKLPAAEIVEPKEEAPFIKGDHGKMGWDIILDVLNQTEEKAIITIDMNGTSVVPGNVLYDIRSKDITVAFDMENGISWSINGQSITMDKANDIDFFVMTGTNLIPTAIVNSVANVLWSTQISLRHNGEFGCIPILSMNLGKEYAGLTTHLYYYNQVSEKLDFVSMAEIREDGTVELAFHHASEYIIVVKAVESLDHSTQTSAETRKTDGSDEETSIVRPNEGEKTRHSFFIIIFCILVTLLVGMLIIGWRKQRDSM